MVERKIYQGVLNIVRFNWHFYFIGLMLLFLLIIISPMIPFGDQKPLIYFAIIVVGFFSLSLAISFHIYDLSDLYELRWLKASKHDKILNINAGFDEILPLLELKVKDLNITSCDFYNEERHNEISIKRARKAFPLSENSIQVNTDQLPFPKTEFDVIILFLSAHEIRNESERINFFIELSRVLKPDGKVYVTEHLRDGYNFLAYNIGFFHFHSRATWLNCFKHADLQILDELKSTPFVTKFILSKV